MADSILDSTKKVLGFEPEYKAFDTDILMHINSVFSTLNQLGVGPLQGFRIENSDSVWADYLLDDLNLNNVKSYLYLRVRLLFDPPPHAFLLTAMESQIKELEWRIMVYVDEERINQNGTFGQENGDSSLRS